MSRTLKLADVIAAVGGVVLIVSSFLSGFSGASYNSWHSLFINQLIVTDLLGFVAAVVIVLASLGLLPKRIPWATWAAAVAFVVLLNSIFAPIQVHEFLHQSRESLKLGIGFYLAIIGAVILAFGACLAWLPFLQVAITGRPKAAAADVGYQGPGGYATYQGPPGQFSPPSSGYPGAAGASQPAGGGSYGSPLPPPAPQGPSFQPQPRPEWSQGASAPDPNRSGPAVAGPVGGGPLGGGSPSGPTGPRQDPAPAWATPWTPSPPQSTTAETSQAAHPTPASEESAAATPRPIQVGSPLGANSDPAGVPSQSEATAGRSSGDLPPFGTGPADTDLGRPQPAASGSAAGQPSAAPADAGPAGASPGRAEPTRWEPTPATGRGSVPSEPEPLAAQPGVETPVQTFQTPEPSAPETQRFSDATQTQAAPTAATAWGESQSPPAPTAPFAPFWAAVPVPRTVYSADQSGLPVGSLQPGVWYAVVARHASGGFIVQLPSGGHGVLVETTDLIRG